MAKSNETPQEITARLLEYGHDLLDEIFKNKANNQRAYGETTLKLRWQAGNLTLVKLIDEADYK